MTSEDVASGDGTPEVMYGRDLALVHHLGFGGYADRCAPGILARLEPVRARGGLVVELGCGSGRLTRGLVDAGLRVVATDASPAMVDLAREEVPDARAVEVLVLPDDPVPEADAVVSVGHVLSYLPDEAAIDAALAAVAAALRPGGLLALDLCGLEYGRRRQDAPPFVHLEDVWAIVTRYPRPRPERFVREITTFVREPDGRWRRADERHVNVLVDVDAIVETLAAHGVEAEVRAGFGDESLPPGLHAILGTRSS